MNTRLTPRPSMICFMTAICLFASGCKSTSWKMPGSSWFASTNEPDPSLLVADTSNPGAAQITGQASGAQQSDLTQSGTAGPAAKYEPTTIASVGASAPPAATVTGTSPYGAGAQATAAAQAGLAAQANGYQTGPYNLGQAGALAATSTVSSADGASLSDKSATPAAPDVTLPKSVTSSLANANTNLPKYPATPANAIGSSPYTGTTPTTPVSYPQVQSPPVDAATPQLPANQFALPAANSGTMPNAAAGVGVGGAANASTGYPNSGYPTAGYPTTSSSTQAESLDIPLPGFSPGTTSRNTGYDFSKMEPSASTLPPNTASGTNPLLR